MNDIHIKRGLLKKASTLMKEKGFAGKAAIVSDETVFALYGVALVESLQAAGFETASFTFPPGEQSKTLATYGDILAFLANSGLDRKSVV